MDNYATLLAKPACTLCDIGVKYAATTKNYMTLRWVDTHQVGRGVVNRKLLALCGNNCTFILLLAAGLIPCTLWLDRFDQSPSR